jgi:hypothetical protein
MPTKIGLSVVGGLLIVVTLYFMLIEKQNKFQRSMQNLTGLNGTLEIYSGGKVVQRFLGIDKLTTATATDSNESRSYRYGYGYNDINLNNIKDDNEKKVYVEVGTYSSYSFFNVKK